MNKPTIANRDNFISAENACTSKCTTLAILEAWNGINVVKHNLSKKGLQRAIDKAVRLFAINDIMVAINNYGIIYHDKDYKPFDDYSTYTWTLPIFLGKENALPEFLNDGGKWINYIQYKDKQSAAKNKAITIDNKPSATSKIISLSYPDYLNFMRIMPYDEYLKTEHWQHFKTQACIYYRHTCQLCGNKGFELHVHHLTYENRGRETFLDISVLCSKCHLKAHRD